MYLVLLLHAMFSLTQPWQSTVDDSEANKIETQVKGPLK